VIVSEGAHIGVLLDESISKIEVQIFGDFSLRAEGNLFG
jgi:hypothetical protein